MRCRSEGGMCIWGQLQGQNHGPSFSLSHATHGSSQGVLITKGEGRGKLPFPLSPHPATNLTLQHLCSTLLQPRPKVDSGRFQPCTPCVSPVWLYHLSFPCLHERNGHLIERQQGLFVPNLLNYSKKKMQLMFSFFLFFLVELKEIAMQKAQKVFPVLFLMLLSLVIKLDSKRCVTVKMKLLCTGSTLKWK